MPAASLRELIERAESATGKTRIGVPRDVELDLVQLVRSPRAFEVAVGGERVRECIAPPLRELAAMRDPVADAHAGWLLAVLANAAGLLIEVDSSLTAPTTAQLTPEGRAWLAMQAIECATTDAQRARISSALGITP